MAGRWLHFLCDDDLVPEDFYASAQAKIALNLGVEMIVVNMRRGDCIPPGLPPLQRHPPTTLIARRDQMRPCAVGLEQMIIKEGLLAKYRFSTDSFHADGELIQKIVQENSDKVMYAPELAVFFNALQPGRWLRRP